jgi:hypothetical protein
LKDVFSYSKTSLGCKKYFGMLNIMREPEEKTLLIILSLSINQIFPFKGQKQYRFLHSSRIPCRKLERLSL